MNNFKRILTALLALVMVLALAACGPSGETKPSDSQKPSENTKPSASKPVETITTAPTEAKAPVTYRVKVVDEQGNPIAGVMVQLCKATCSLQPTNAEGYAEFTNPVEDGYHANIASAPEGFAFDPKFEVDFKSGETELTFTLKAAEKTEA